MTENNASYRDENTGKPKKTGEIIRDFHKLNHELESESFDTVSFLQELVRKPSVTPNAHDSIQLCKEQFEKRGFSIETMTFINDKGEEVPNLVASYGNGEPHTVLSGHLDVVDPGEVDKWTLSDGNPYAGNITYDEKGEKVLVGRGAVDMKGPTVSAMGAAFETIGMYKGGPDKFPGKMTFILSGDEETGGLYGTRLVLDELDKRGEKFTQCLVVEPSSREHNCDEGKIGSRGILHTNVNLNGQIPNVTGDVTISMELKGQQGHTGHPTDAKNPIWHQSRIIKELYDENDPVTVAGQKVRIVPVNTESGGYTRNVSPEISSVTFACNLELSKDEKDDLSKIGELDKEISRKIDASKNINGFNNTEVKVSYNYNPDKKDGKPAKVSKDSVLWYDETNPLYRAAKMIAATEKPLDNGNEHFSDATQMVPTRVSQDEILFDCRYTDNYNAGTLKTAISERLDSAVDGKRQDEYKFNPLAEAFYSHPGKEVNAMCDSIANVTGRQPRKVTTGGASDMRFFKCPAIEIGPRDATLHAVNENIPVETIKEVQRIFSRVLGDISRNEQAKRLGIDAAEIPADKIDRLRKIRTGLGVDENNEGKDILYVKPEDKKAKIIIIEKDDKGRAVDEVRKQLDEGKKLQVLHIPSIKGYKIESTGKSWDFDGKNKEEKLTRFAHQYDILHEKITGKKFPENLEAKDNIFSVVAANKKQR